MMQGVFFNNLWAPFILQKLINAVGFQIVWFTCALGVNYSQPYSYLIVLMTTFLFIAHHLYFCSHAISELRFIFKIVLLGWMMDTLLLQNNLISFSSPYTAPFSLIQPYWMTCLWFALGATINHSLSWLKKTKAWSTVFGLAFGTLSYLAGSRFGVIHFESNLGILFTALAWALLVPLFVLISQCQSLELSQSKSN